MLFTSLASMLLLPAAIRAAALQNTTTTSSSASTACNNSPDLCSKAYNKVTYLGAHDSPFVRDASNDYSTSGNQYYDSPTQLSAGVRLLTAQVQLNGQDLHVCHTSCDLLDAGLLSDWLGSVKTWMDSNPNEVVTILLVNGASASASDLAQQYDTAGITSSLAYTPTGSTSETQQWPTLESMISSGTRLVNFVASLSDNTGASYLMNEWTYIFENNYNVTDPSGFSCEANRPTNLAGQTSQAISNDMMPLMNHFLDENEGNLFGTSLETPNDTYASTTNAASGGVGNLGTAATECTQTYGRAPSYILVDFFNVGPAIDTVDRLNGVTNAVGRTAVSTSAPSATSAGNILMSEWSVWMLCLTGVLGLAML